MQPCCDAYTVKPGETIFSIAIFFSLVPDEITAYSRLPKSANVQPGQIIQIPCVRVVAFLIAQQSTVQSSSFSSPLRSSVPAQAPAQSVSTLPPAQSASALPPAQPKALAQSPPPPPGSTLASKYSLHLLRYVHRICDISPT